jgi:hypothetical protein
MAASMLRPSLLPCGTLRRQNRACASKQPPSSTVASGAVGQWLAQIDTDAMVEGLLCEPACFVIEPKRAFKKPKRPKGQPDDTPARYLLSIRPFRQRGRAGEWTPIHLWEIQQNRLQISLPALRLLARMAPEALGGDFTGDKMPRGRHGWQWLCEAAGLGLLHWKAPGGQALTIGPDNMKAEFVWRLLADGSRCLDLTGLPAGVEVGAGDPPLVIDEATATITLIDAGISPTAPVACSPCRRSRQPTSLILPRGGANWQVMPSPHPPSTPHRILRSRRAQFCVSSSKTRSSRYAALLASR